MNTGDRRHFLLKNNEYKRTLSIANLAFGKGCPHILAPMGSRPKGGTYTRVSAGARGSVQGRAGACRSPWKRAGACGSVRERAEACRSVRERSMYVLHTFSFISVESFF